MHSYLVQVCSRHAHAKTMQPRSRSPFSVLPWWWWWCCCRCCSVRYGMQFMPCLKEASESIWWWVGSREWCHVSTPHACAHTPACLPCLPVDWLAAHCEVEGGWVGCVPVGGCSAGHSQMVERHWRQPRDQRSRSHDAHTPLPARIAMPCHAMPCHAMRYDTPRKLMSVLRKGKESTTARQQQQLETGLLSGGLRGWTTSRDGYAHAKYRQDRQSARGD
ncbi:hypothetical protein IWX90DRAFT_438591 [Phyllosticta citrichinensis]|uniref:Uncharacterized protein n=1 Tax=Phyllosticta citrichinensis TaxID=1130410 RepID=A0ABR1XNK0_9PEZI